MSPPREPWVRERRELTVIHVTHILGLESVLSVLAPLQFSGDFLYYALVFFVLALVAAFVGFRGVAGISMEIARIFVLLFVVLAVVAIIL